MKTILITLILLIGIHCFAQETALRNATYKKVFGSYGMRDYGYYRTLIFKDIIFEWFVSGKTGVRHMGYKRAKYNSCYKYDFCIWNNRKGETFYLPYK